MKLIIYTQCECVNRVLYDSHSMHMLSDFNQHLRVCKIYYLLWGVGPEDLLIAWVAKTCNVGRFSSMVSIPMNIPINNKQFEWPKLFWGLNR